jgi:hypothetical protein
MTHPQCVLPHSTGMAETVVQLGKHMHFRQIPVLAQREMEKRGSSLVHKFRPFGAGIFGGIGGLSSDTSDAMR